MTLPSLFHMHLVSDATGETLAAIAKAAIVQYQNIRAIEHVHPLVRTQRQLKRVLADIEAEPGIVLYTVVNQAAGGRTRTALPEAEDSLPRGVAVRSCKFSKAISARRKRRRSRASTCSMPIISGASTR